MMGALPQQQNALFYDFCLEKHIPQHHLLRHIDQFLDFEPIRHHLQSLTLFGVIRGFIGD